MEAITTRVEAIASSNKKLLVVKSVKVFPTTSPQEVSTPETAKKDRWKLFVYN